MRKSQRWLLVWLSMCATCSIGTTWVFSCAQDFSMNTMSLEEMSESVVKRWPQVVATFVGEPCFQSTMQEDRTRAKLCSHYWDLWLWHCPGLEWSCHPKFAGVLVSGVLLCHQHHWFRSQLDSVTYACGSCTLWTSGWWVWAFTEEGPANFVFPSQHSGWLVWRVGPRWTMITCAIPYLLGSILYILAYHLDNVRCIYAGRVLTGDLRSLLL